MGRLPQYGKNVSLILNIKSGLVGTQLHVTHDPSFEFLHQYKFASTLQYLAGTTGAKATKTLPTKDNTTNTINPTRMVGATDACNNVSKTKKWIIKFVSTSTTKKANLNQGRNSSTPVEGAIPVAARSLTNMKLSSTKTEPINIPD